MLRAFAVLLLLQSQVLAWNALGHKVVAEIAWQELDAQTRQQIADVLRRNPRFDIDFAKQMPSDITAASKEEQDHWIFQQAGTWPDIIRKTEYDRPIWHYVNFPLFLNGERQVTANLSMDYPTKIDISNYNVAQATKYCIAAIKSNTSPDAKALAYCWLFHLVGDMHQPMHSTALFCDNFPTGDRGGNEIPLVQGKNLHSLWDNLLGRQSRMNDVKREVTELKSDRDAWIVDPKSNIDQWIQESHELAKSFAYDQIILQAVRDTTPGTKMQPVNLPKTYLREAGHRARKRIVAAGMRLANLLKP